MAKKVAAELRAELARRRLSGRQVAHHIQMPHATVTRWLNGDTAITLDGLAMICGSLGLPIAELLARAEVTSPTTPVVPLADQVPYVTKRYQTCSLRHRRTWARPVRAYPKLTKTGSSRPPNRWRSGRTSNNRLNLHNKITS